MYITAEIIAALEARYGAPDEVRWQFEMSPREFDVVRRSQKHDRAHDVTLFIIEGEQVVVIKKPFYPPDVYRAPSGGVAPGEAFEVGALREAYEETGLRVELERYLVRARVKFTRAGDEIDWVSHVFSAQVTGGLLAPIDTHEIVEARFATVAEVLGPMREAMLASGSTGLRYRARLQDVVMAKLIAIGRLPAA
ncbi:MAG TPA: NUDIX hydrolase [Blastocatellia bacterium]|nr:NUDIX hydrolase [Blastocatellia bacterium]